MTLTNTKDVILISSNDLRTHLLMARYKYCPLQTFATILSQKTVKIPDGLSNLERSLVSISLSQGLIIWNLQLLVL